LPLAWNCPSAVPGHPTKRGKGRIFYLKKGKPIPWHCPLAVPDDPTQTPKMPHFCPFPWWLGMVKISCRFTL